MIKDPIVEEVRKIRERIARESEFDLHKIFTTARLRQNERQTKAAEQVKSSAKS